MERRLQADQMGGLGLINPEEIDKANSLRLLSYLFSQAELPWIDIAFSSLARATHPQLSIPGLTPSSPTPSSFRTAWSALRPSAQLPKDPSWRSVLSAGHSHPPALVLGSWKTADLLSIPPSILSAVPSLSRLESLAPLYHHCRRPCGGGPGYGAFRLSDRETAAGIGRARKDWQEEVDARPIELKKLWVWVQRRPAMAREADTHWRLLHGVLATRGRLHRLGHAEGEECFYCGLKDDVGHAFFSCAFSSSFWDEYRTLLISSLSPSFTPIAFNA
ncbi:hypothetical protein JCM8547_006808 [Rhodosporidiobolus lusitaniae]